jgi:hypothetical protein
MKLQFVNHASFVIEQGPIRLISDPWLEGPVFNDGWDLLAPSQFRYEDFRDITHIWFSHEHPDHFNPPNVKKIPEECRRNITVLFQHTNDKKVVKYCQNLGFKAVQELPFGKWIEIAPQVEVKCCGISVEWEADSWLCVRTPELTLLNLNDCGIDSPGYALEVQRQVGSVDVLATQFSYAAWNGNPDQKERRLRWGAHVMDNVICQIRELKPRWVIPFASFVWFCHEENYFMNDAMNPIRDVARRISDASAAPVVLYPGDTWEAGAPYDNEPAIARYEADVESVVTKKRPLIPAKPSIPFEKLQEMAESFRKDCLDQAGRLAVFHVNCWNLEKQAQESKAGALNSALTAVFGTLSGRTGPAHVFLTDHGQSYSLSLSGGLRRGNHARQDCDIAISSESLALCFKLAWGGETLRINGRFEAPPGGREYRFFNTFRFARSVNLGMPMAWGRVATALGRRIPVVGRLVAGSA